MLKCRIFITNELTEDLYARLSNLNFPILVICTSYSENINFYSSNIRIAQISQTLMMQRYNDLCYLTGFGKGFYNLNENELNEYSFGKLKSYKFLQGILYLEAEKYLKKDDKIIEYLNKKETLDRYYMLQGKNLTIHVTEENMEKVRHIVTLLKSLKYSGIFYNEITTLDLIRYNFDKIDEDLTIKSFIETLEKIYKELFKNNKKSFWSLDYYLNTFTLLDSNINILCKLY